MKMKHTGVVMFNFLFNRKKLSQDLAKAVVNETSKLLCEQTQKNMDEFNHIKEILAHLSDKMGQLESRLSSKELKDHSEYGHMSYKLAELQSELKKP